MLLVLLELCLLLLRRKRRGDVEFDLTDEPVESESRFCFRFLYAKSISRFIASGLWMRTKWEFELNNCRVCCMRHRPTFEVDWFPLTWDTLSVSLHGWWLCFRNLSATSMQLAFVHRHGTIEASHDRPLAAEKSQLPRVSSDTMVHRSPKTWFAWMYRRNIIHLLLATMPESQDKLVAAFV